MIDALLLWFAAIGVATLATMAFNLVMVIWDRFVGWLHRPDILKRYDPRISIHRPGQIIVKSRGGADD